MVEKSKKTKKEIEFEQKLGELTQDLQRTRADFENFSKRVESEKTMARESGKMNAVIKLLPVIDNIERAIAHTPPELAKNAWAQGVTSLTKNLDKQLESLGVKRIDASAGVAFNPDLHEAIQFDEDAEGEHEIVAEQLQTGYMLNGQPIRHAMVKVTKK